MAYTYVGAVGLPVMEIAGFIPWPTCLAVGMTTVLDGVCDAMLPKVATPKWKSLHLSVYGLRCHGTAEKEGRMAEFLRVKKAVGAVGGEGQGCQSGPQGDRSGVCWE